jgi:hypothetical protein
MVVLDPLCNIVKVKPAGFLFTRGFENGSVRFTAFRIDDVPNSILLLNTVNIRSAMTDGKIVGTASFFKQAPFQFSNIHQASVETAL